MKKTFGHFFLVIVLFAVLSVMGCASQEPQPVSPTPPDSAGLGAALWQAAASCSLAPMKSLLKAGADPNIKYGPERTTPLMEALRSYNNSCPKDTIALLILAGADVNHQSASGFSALHYAASRNCVKQNLEAMVFLLEKGADPYLLDDENRTPVQLAAIINCRKKVSVLAEFMARHPPQPKPPEK